MKTWKDNAILDLSKLFAIRIIRLYKYLVAEKQEYILSRQILRSGTSIGANVRESVNAQSTMDFISKLSIALKEANETEYWLELLHETDYLNDSQYQSIYADCRIILSTLTKIIVVKKKKEEERKSKIKSYKHE